MTAGAVLLATSLCDQQAATTPKFVIQIRMVSERVVRIFGAMSFDTAFQYTAALSSCVL